MRFGTLSWDFVGAKSKLIFMPMGQTQTFEGHGVNSDEDVDITRPGPHTQDLWESYVAWSNEWQFANALKIVN